MGSMAAKSWGVYRKSSQEARGARTARLFFPWFTRWEKWAKSLKNWEKFGKIWGNFEIWKSLENLGKIRKIIKHTEISDFDV
jgi:hypothetical protein